ncbi:uncharacterized protein [Coffea arabica]|uniref:Uncharacterized protein isoform X3 n=1 Tax=Coffea arabica TaxID=13443 RepID=A0ABM4WEX3_COFAR
MPPLTVSGTSSINFNSLSLTQNPSLNHLNFFNSRTSFPSSYRAPLHDPLSPSLLSSSGLCRASQLAELFPTMSPDIVVREARLEDCWEVAETHCSSFFPQYSFPLDFALRIDRLIGMLFGFSLPGGCQRTCLVAVTGQSDEDTLHFWNEDLKIGGFDGKFSLNKGYVAGILTVDTVADFLPRKGPLRQRRHKLILHLEHRHVGFGLLLFSDSNTGKRYIGMLLSCSTFPFWLNPVKYSKKRTSTSTQCPCLLLAKYRFIPIAILATGQI